MKMWDRRLEGAILSGAHAAAGHWLALANMALAIFVALPLLAPLLLANGYPGVADAIYTMYSMTCHQQPHRSYFVGGPHLTYGEEDVAALTTLRPLSAFRGSPETGYKMAYCERDAATYAALLLFGLAYGVVRRRLPRLSIPVYALLLAPLAVDGLSQLAGWRESTWLLRTITGGLFGLATAWLLLPEVDQAIHRGAQDMEERLHSQGSSGE